jgi:Tfp pilus assembly protein PilX
MAIKKTQRGFALLVAVIFMSVMLALGLALGSLGYKQEVLASSAIESQYAFYAADSALECALYADQQENLFAFNPDLDSPPPSITCNNAAPFSVSIVSYTSSLWVTFNRISLVDSTNSNRCADVTVYKYSAPQPPLGITTYIYSQGYDVPCATVQTPSGARFVSRGISSHY